ncbi:MAG TPA: FAD-linked oxidase C-terminal domain-containing protein [Solirubrobacteraceae bacterium]|nr:FAD-linked oxidase C-terminal domain-containing protein [Solirubrobacteraceae bacterium]
MRPGTSAEYLTDATEAQNLRGRADAVALPGSAAQVADVVRWCYAHDVPVIPRGGGSGYSGGAVPLDGGIVLGLERLAGVPRFDAEYWRVRLNAGVRTADLHHRAREHGLYFPPDPGAAEQSMIGGNIATNAGGPHTFKYGVTGTWVTGLEVVLAPGELVQIGGAARKDVAGYDLRSLLVGSEGTLGVITAATLRLIPAPEAALPIVALYPTVAAGCAALRTVLATGLVPAALEYLDGGALAAAAAGFPGGLSAGAGMMLIAEADGTPSGASALRAELVEALSHGASVVRAPEQPSEISALWRWRSGVSPAVIAQRGGKLSEDIVVPVERLEEAIAETVAIGARHGLPACSWGHAGDGNLHSTMMIDRHDPDQLTRARAAAHELFALAVTLGGAVSGEHGIGAVKRGALGLQWPAPALALHEAIKQTFDPKGLLNPGKKLALASEPSVNGVDRGPRSG